MSPSIADLVRLDSVCDAFEESWKAGSRPRLEEYLESTNLPSATLFVELVQIDIDYRRRHGEHPSVNEYAAKFPQFEDALSEIASLVGVSDPTVSVPVKPLPMLGRFELRSELGRGSFGVVWKAWDTKMRRWVALKQFHEGIGRGNRTLYEREARSVAQLDHPNVVRVLELSEGTASDYIVFELIEGESLKSWLSAREGKPVDPKLAARIVQQIAEGLQHVHERGIIHRDLKPGNILITKEGVPKLADFGLARHLESVSTIAQDKTLLGTIPYMSPEQCRSEKVTAATDIYSLGVVLYELLAGRRPFSGPQSELMAQIQYKPAPPFQPKGNVPPDLERICRRAMEKEPADRYAPISAMAADLRLFLAGEPISGSRIHYRKIARKILSRRSLITGALGVAASLATYAVLARQLEDDGLIQVSLTSNPPGAELALIPLDEATGRPLAAEIVRSTSRTPVELRLKPCGYLVTAALEDGRFHEVYRHVPENLKTKPGFYRHERWELTGSGVTLPPIVIPPANVTAGMAFVDGAERFSLAAPVPDAAPSERSVRIPAFYIDTHELTVGDYKQIIKSIWGEESPAAQSESLGPSADDGMAKTLSWDEAVARAEWLGKRLVCDWEYEVISTARGNQPYPWGVDLAPELSAPKRGPVRTPDFDRVRSNGVEIFGLASNVAEWVDCYELFSPRLRTVDGLPENAHAQLRAVRGDYRVFDNSPQKRPETPDPRHRSLLSRYNGSLAGLRCARSVAPRLTPDAFPSPALRLSEGGNKKGK